LCKSAHRGRLSKQAITLICQRMGVLSHLLQSGGATATMLAGLTREQNVTFADDQAEGSARMGLLFCKCSRLWGESGVFPMEFQSPHFGCAELVNQRGNQEMISFMTIKTYLQASLGTLGKGIIQRCMLTAVVIYLKAMLSTYHVLSEGCHLGGFQTSHYT